LSKSAPYINPLPSCNCYLLTYLLTGLSSCNRDLPTHRPCKLQLRLTYLHALQAATETYLPTGLSSCNRDLLTYRPFKLQPRLTYLQAFQAATETYILTGLSSCNRDLPTYTPCKLQPRLTYSQALQAATETYLLRARCRNARLTVRLANRRLTLTGRLTWCRVARSSVS